MFKKKFPNLNKRSFHYKKQKKFEGSTRQLRGKILKILLTKKVINKHELMKELNINEKKLSEITIRLEREGFITKKDKQIVLNT
ncbi:MAG: hypothetical protein ACTSU4_06730 [Promethearchaeota archaeon]